ncbi:MAG: hypothetical protein ACTSRS_06510 [Candidatus Helarchaeota archaeon]
MQHTYSEIPDHVRAKPYFPLLVNVWEIFQTYGWDRTLRFIEECKQGVYDFFETRLNESIGTSKNLIEGKYTEEQAKKILSYILILPSMSIRSDLIQGTQKLIAGESADVTFISLDDVTGEIFALLNGHLEDGIPVDWWLVRPEDELLERRHLKLGYKLKEIPRRFNDITKASSRLIDIFRDIRNERTPQWADATYFAATVWVSFALNVIFEPSNFESLVSSYDGWAAKQLYKMPDYLFAFIPWPSMLNLFFLQGRRQFCNKLSWLTTEGHLFLQPFEESTLEVVKDLHAEIFALYKKGILEDGIPFPIQTMDSSFPNVKNKSDPDRRFLVEYPPDQFIQIENLGLDFEDVLKGVYLDITTETQPSDPLDPSKVISLGIGRSTIFR